jgi:hypothetical protein
MDLLKQSLTIALEIIAWMAFQTEISMHVGNNFQKSNNKEAGFT